jgi:hypothetical protein
MRVLLPLAATLVFAVAAAPAAAHHGVRVKTIATDLDNPRHVAVTHAGDVYVAEAGRGGNPATSRSCFNSAEGPSCTGATGAVTKISRHRGHFHQDRVLKRLASFAPATGESAIGPHGVFATHGNVYVTNGGPTAPWRGADPTATVLRDPTLVSEEPISRLYGTLLKLRKHKRFDVVADLWRFERDNNPDAQVGNPLIDSNPVDVYAAHGRLLVADAGGNTVLEVSKRGRVRVLSLFPNIPTPDPDGVIIPMNAVPTGIVAGPDGAFYMSQLTGYPFPVGGAKIFRIDPRSGAYTTYASGFTNAMDLDFGRDGTLYVLEIDHDSLLGPSTDGAIWAVPPGGGAPKRIALPAGTTLTAPGGLAVAGRRTLVVSNHGREAGEGEVLEISW